MSYLESSEYKDAKSQLKDEYEICFNKIETYIPLANIYGLHQAVKNMIWIIPNVRIVKSSRISPNHTLNIWYDHRCKKR